MTSPGDKILAIRLREVRKSRGLTQKQVAELADIPYESYSGYERAESQAPFHRIYKVSRALGVSLDYLAGSRPDPVPIPTPASPPTGSTPTLPDHPT